MLARLLKARGEDGFTGTTSTDFFSLSSSPKADAPAADAPAADAPAAAAPSAEGAPAKTPAKGAKRGKAADDGDKPAAKKSRKK